MGAKRDFKAEKAAVWRQQEEQLGFPLPGKFRTFVERRLEIREDGDADDLAGLARAVPEYVELAGSLAGAFQDRAGAAPRIKKCSAQGEGPRLNKAIQRHLRLVEFVADRLVSFSRLVDGCILPGRGVAGGLPWDAVAGEWNREHPEDAFTSGATLKREYYLAAGEKPIARAFLGGLQRLIDEEYRGLRELAETLDSFRKRNPHRYSRAVIRRTINSEDGPRLVKALERFVGACRTAGVSPSTVWRAEYRRRLTRRDLVQAHLAAACGPNATSRRLNPDTPLRYWFLTEARGVAPASRPGATPAKEPRPKR